MLKREFSGGTAGEKGRERRGVCIPLRVKVGRGGRAGGHVGEQGGKTVCWSKLLAAASAQLEQKQWVSGASSCTMS